MQDNYAILKTIKRNYIGGCYIIMNKKKCKILFKTKVKRLCFKRRSQTLSKIRKKSLSGYSSNQIL